MGLIDAIAIGIFGTVLLQRDEKKMAKRNEKRQQWLRENGYDIEKQLEINRWCQSNIEVAIEETYGYAYRTMPWEKIYRQWLRGSLPVRKQVCKHFCKKQGIEYFDFDHPPKKYREIA